MNEKDKKLYILYILLIWDNVIVVNLARNRRKDVK